MDQEEDLLECLLAATEELEKQNEDNVCLEKNIAEASVKTNAELGKSNFKPREHKKLKDTDIFQFETNLKLSEPKKANDLIHNGDTDSSDDEGNRNYENKKYNPCGQEIKGLLSTNHDSALNINSISSSHYGVPKQRVSTWKNNPNIASASTSQSITVSSKPMFGKLLETEKKHQDVFMDPIFGMRIINPLISSQLLTERMQGRLAVKLSDISKHIFAGNLKDKDWVMCAVVVSKSPPKTSQKGSQYSIWTLSDLKDDIKTFSLFMFSGAHKDLWKTTIGTVIGILNPTIMDQKDGSKQEVTLSINNAQKIMVFGQSKDFGICKSMKNNGDKCTAIVNLSRCEFCIYHIKQEYQKCSKRSELQANFAGQGLVNLRNKVLGKNEVFYAGKSFTAIPAKKSRKLEVKDNNILHKLNDLSGFSSSNVKAKNAPKKIKGAARRLDVNPAQRARDLKLLERLGGWTSLESKTNFSGNRSDEVTLEDSKATTLNILSKLKERKAHVQKDPKRNAQYSIKNDLFVNIENKKTFSGNISEEVSLAESKNKAAEVIAKLKAKNQKTDKNININDEGSCNKDDLLSFDDMEDDLNCENLNYSDDESNDGVSEPLLPQSTTKSKEIVLEKMSNKDTTRNNCNKSSENKINALKPSPDKTNIITPKSVTKNRESFEKISPKISKTLFSPEIDKKPAPRRESTLPTSSPSTLNKSIKDLLPESQNKTKLDSMAMDIPILHSGFGKNDLIDLNKPIGPRHVVRAKVNAIKFIQRNGPIKKVDPNSTRGSASKKRNIESLLGTSDKQGQDPHPAKKSKLQESEFISDRFKKMMAMTSKYAGLLEQHDDEEKEKYFKKLEVKEQMEEKMTNTHKVKCKAVRCLQCKYTNFSASDLCKKERHPLKVCKKFNEIGSRILSRGFIQLEKRHVAIYKRVKSALPRRESERKNHPLAKHCDILQGVETRMSMLNMTYMRYIENRLICFVPGKVLDEIKSILDLVESNQAPPRTHLVLQELRDLSSMAMEHFDEHILPRCKEQLDQRTGTPEKILKELEVVAGSLSPYTKFQDLYKNAASSSKSTRLLFHQQLPHTLTSELYKVKKVTKSHKHHISYLTQNTQKLCLKLRRQANKLRIQTAKIREQERKIQEQNSKIVEQEAALVDIKKHIDEWDQKYKDLTAELVRARDEILLQTSTNTSPILSNSLLTPPVLGGSTNQSSTFKSNIKPRSAHILPRNYLSFDFERKRKSSLSTEIPIKRNRSPSASVISDCAPKVGEDIQNLNLNIPDLETFEKFGSVKESESTLAKSLEGANHFISNILSSSWPSVKARKRKMTEDIDLK